MKHTPNKPCPSDLFDQVRMGYAVVTTARLDEWRLLLDEGLGMDVNTLAGKLVCRIDERSCRFLIKESAREDLHALGLEMATDQALAIALQRLKQRDIAVHKVVGAEALERGVPQLWRFEGPKSLLIELFVTPGSAATSPKMKASGFVTGELGFGHVAIVTQRPKEMLAFWQDIFNMRHSDDVHQRISGVALEFNFLRFNKRHHSIALGFTTGLKLNPFRTRIQHMEVQVATLEDLVQAYERCKKLGLTISMEMGQHANDRAISFYVKTPCGFDFEYGWNPLAVDEHAWHPEVWDKISLWGHRPEGVDTLDRLGQLGHALASVVKKEFIPA